MTISVPEFGQERRGLGRDAHDDIYIYTSVNLCIYMHKEKVKQSGVAQRTVSQSTASLKSFFEQRL